MTIRSSFPHRAGASYSARRGANPPVVGRRLDVVVGILMSAGYMSTVFRNTVLA